MVTKILFYLVAFLTCYQAFGKVVERDKPFFPAVNIVKNGGAEEGFAGWTSSGGTFALESTEVALGARAFSFSATAADQYIESPALTLPKGLKSSNCVVMADVDGIIGGNNNMEMQVLDASSNVIFEQAISTNSTYSVAKGNFICPDTTSLKVRFNSTDASSVHYIDNVGIYSADRVNISQVSQAQFYGAVNWPAAAGCYWSAAGGSSFSGFNADADCTLPTGSNIEGKASAPATKIPAITFAEMPAGRYVITAMTNIYNETTDSQPFTYSRFHDGTNAWKGVTHGGGYFNSASNKSYKTGIIIGEYTYDTAQTNVTIELQARVLSAGGATIEMVTEGTYISVYYYPTESQTAITPDSTALSWSGYHDTNCSWSTSSTSYADPAGDATCTFTELTNSNFGVVSSVADGTGNQPQITFTPKETGLYFACVINSSESDVAAGLSYSALTDGDNNVLSEGLHRDSAIGYIGSSNKCGVLNVTALTAQVLKLKLKTSSGSTYINRGENLRTSWQIFNISQGMNQPQILNQVSTPASGGVKIASAYIDYVGGTPTIIRQDGTWISSITDTDTGRMKLNLVAGTFSASPNCFGTGWTDEYTLNITAKSNSSTDVDIVVLDTTSATALYDGNPYVLCIGAK